MSADVKFDNIWVRFGSFVAARDVNIHIQEGEFYTILGPSGCGKTTLLRCVSGFLNPSEGNIFIGGQNMAGIGPNKRPTALIFQNLALFPLMTVRAANSNSKLPPINNDGSFQRTSKNA